MLLTPIKKSKNEKKNPRDCFWSDRWIGCADYHGKSKTKTQNFFLGYDHYFYVKNIEIYVHEFFKHNDSSVASVMSKQSVMTRVLFFDK